MAADLGLLSSSQHQKLALTQAQQQSNPSLSISSSWMWNPRQAQEDDDSWEVRAFAEDTGNIMGTTWPPRSYSCTFCRREFRSAQALGGHMNVHRRDRARLRHSPPVGDSAASPASSSALIFPAQDFVSNGTGLCLLYTLPSPSDSTHVFNSIPMNGCTDDSPSSTTLLSVSPFPTNDYFMPSNCSPLNFPVAASVHGSSIYQCSSKVESTYKYIADDDNNKNIKESIIEELDLELRLGSRSSP